MSSIEKATIGMVSSDVRVSTYKIFQGRICSLHCVKPNNGHIVKFSVLRPQNSLVIRVYWRIIADTFFTCYMFKFDKLRLYVHINVKELSLDAFIQQSISNCMVDEIKSEPPFLHNSISLNHTKVRIIA